MGSHQAAPTSRRLVRLALWIALLLGVAATYWFFNLTIFHWWAAYVPPRQTELHLRWAMWSAVAFAASGLCVFIVARRLYLDRKPSG